MIDETPGKGKSKLRILREQTGLTQRDLSEYAQVTERNIYDWENGVSIPRLDKAVLLAKALRVPLKQICSALGIDVSGIPNDPGGDQQEDEVN